MKLFFTLLFTTFFTVAFTQTWPSSCIATPEMAEAYRNDVYKVAIPRLFEINDPFKDSVVIPARFRDSIAKAFYAIHNMPPSLLKDTIINGFRVMNDSYNDSLRFLLTMPLNKDRGSIKSISIGVPVTVAWAIQWAAGNYNNTSEPQVNDLVNTYGLNVHLDFSFGGNYYFSVKAAIAVNTPALAKKFSDILALPTSANVTFYGGDRTGAVGMAFDNDGIRVSYRNGCGDCPAGCTFGRIWNFKVYFSNCSVEYLGATNFGLALPPGSPVFTCFNFILPVNFSSINGLVKDGLPTINWTVLEQSGVREYLVERSDNGTLFYSTGTVPANPLQNNYKWQDSKPLMATTFFRIKSVDFDGSYKYSATLKLAASSKASLLVYPNPVINRQLNIQVSGLQPGLARATINTVTGKQVWSGNIDLASSNTSFTLPSIVNRGIYSLSIELGAEQFRKLIVVE